MRHMGPCQQQNSNNCKASAHVCPQGAPCVDRCTNVRVQVWYAFSGNGSQWPKMGATLLGSNPTFRAAVVECAAAVRPFELDLLAEFDKERGWGSPLLGAVGLLAVQIGLVDVLREDYGILPKGMLGHSAGERTWAADCTSDESLAVHQLLKLPPTELQVLSSLPCHMLRAGLQHLSAMSA